MSGFTLSAYPRIGDLMWRVRQGRVASSDAYLQNKFLRKVFMFWK